MKCHCRVHNSALLVRLLKYMDPVHTLISYFKIHFNNILPSMLRSFECHLSFRFPDWTIVCISRLSHFTLIGLITRIKFGEDYILWMQKLLFSKSSAAHNSNDSVYQYYFLSLSVIMRFKSRVFIGKLFSSLELHRISLLIFPIIHPLWFCRISHE